MSDGAVHSLMTSFLTHSLNFSNESTMSFTSDIEVGEAYKLSSKGQIIYVRAVEPDLDSASMLNENDQTIYSKHYFVTPHGTLFLSGRSYFSKITLEEEIEKLQEFEKDAEHNEINPFSPYLERENNRWIRTHKEINFIK